MKLATNITIKNLAGQEIDIYLPDVDDVVIEECNDTGDESDTYFCCAVRMNDGTTHYIDNDAIVALHIYKSAVTFKIGKVLGMRPTKIYTFED